MAYTPATAAAPRQMEGERGASHPAVGVGLGYHAEDRYPGVVLHIDGAGKGEDVDLRADEARRVAALLLQAADTLDGPLARTDADVYMTVSAQIETIA